MIDLHLHLDGSLRPSSVLEMAKEQKVDIGTTDLEELTSLMKAPAKCLDLNEYLKRFEIPLKVLQVPEAIERVVFELIEDLVKQKIYYTEIRFAPQLSCEKGMTIDQVTRHAIKGVETAYRKFGQNIMVNLILCCMRGNSTDNKSKNLETMAVGRRYFDAGVAALDLAGAEALFKTKEFDYIFNDKNCITSTIHAGEADSAESIADALKFNVTKRIGHGVRAAESSSVMENLKNKGIFLEMCPTSNYQTNAVDKIENHPILQYLNAGLRVTVNTDNMTVSDTTLRKEYKLLKDKLHIDNQHIKSMVFNSLEGAFLGAKDRALLLDKVLKTDIDKWLEII